MRIFNRRRTSKAPYARHSFTPSTPPAAARIADGFPLSAVGRPRRHGLRSRCFTASKGKPLHFTARSHPQTHGKTGTSTRAPAFARPFPPAHTPVCPKTAFISAYDSLPLSGRRRQAPAAKHPSLRDDDSGLLAITSLFRSPAGTP